MDVQFLLDMSHVKRNGIHADPKLDSGSLVISLGYY
jgi:hypothetical protein